MRKVLITGGLGFIGSHLTKRLCKDYEVTVLDNDSTPFSLYRLDDLKKNCDFEFIVDDIQYEITTEDRFDIVINLAAKAGVRDSIKQPVSYFNNNIKGFINILEYCRKKDVEHLIYASSSSVYSFPSMYAVTKYSNELMANSYERSYNLKTTGLRFFSVYGEWGRPDMVLFKFVDNMVKGKPIDLYNYGNIERNFTYVDDIVDGIEKVVRHDQMGCLTNVYDLGNSSKRSLHDLVRITENVTGITSKKEFCPPQLGDPSQPIEPRMGPFEDTFGKIDWASLEYGIERFWGWYKDFYKL